MLSLWEETPYSRRLPTDQRLRRHGFAIFSRPKGRPAVWIRGKALFIESEALKVCLKEVLARR
jgi:hypothetical protein